MKNLMDKIPVLDHGFVRLDDYMTDDLSVVNSARVSFDQRHDMLEDNDAGLINFLLKNHHGTPFEHNAFRFHIKAPIFVFREWQRHRIGSFNEMSARYVELEPEWYIPAIDQVRTRIGAPGRYEYVPCNEQISRAYRDELSNVCRDSYGRYKYYMNKGVAPEVARNFLHVNHYSQMYWTVNARSLMNFVNLRNAPTAQFEIMKFAVEVEVIFGYAMPITHRAFVVNGRIAP